MVSGFQTALELSGVTQKAPAVAIQCQVKQFSGILYCHVGKLNCCGASLEVRLNWQILFSEALHFHGT
jgi:hypothetical protein